MSAPVKKHTVKCRCSDDCRARANAYERRRKLDQYYGRSLLVDAAPVREHVRRLQEARMGVDQITVAAGLGRGVIACLLWGQPWKGAPPTARMRPENAAAILAVRPRLALLGERVAVDGTGTRRRLQALTAIGWSQVQLGRELGLTQTRVYQLLSQDRVGAGTALTVRALYNRLWDTPPSPANRFETGAITRARRYAEAHGWCPPMAWDDETIDDPDAAPDLGAPSTAAFDVDEYLRLRVEGVSLEEFARRHGVSKDAVTLALRRRAAASGNASRAKLTPEQADEIRRRAAVADERKTAGLPYETRRQLAAEYGVSAPLISDVINGHRHAGAERGAA